MCFVELTYWKFGLDPNDTSMMKYPHVLTNIRLVSCRVFFILTYKLLCVMFTFTTTHLYPTWKLHSGTCKGEISETLYNISEFMVSITIYNTNSSIKKTYLTIIKIILVKH